MLNFAMMSLKCPGTNAKKTIQVRTGGVNIVPAMPKARINQGNQKIQNALQSVDGTLSIQASTSKQTLV